MSAVMIKFEDNYSDEFDVEGFCVYKETDSWLKDFSIACAYVQRELDRQLAEWVAKHGEPKYSWEGRGSVEAYFGTNEFLTYETVDEYRRCFKVTELSDAEYEFFAKWFPLYGGRIGYGELCAFPHNIVE